MKIKDIELANISRYRGELMGAAMLFIILFHVALPREDAFFGLRRMGNVGVEMFLFPQRYRSVVLVDEESFCQAISSSAVTCVSTRPGSSSPACTTFPDSREETSRHGST